MTHELSEKIAGLASRIDNLSTTEQGNNSRYLMQLCDELTKLTTLSIRLDFDARDADYSKALQSINTSIELINNADKSIEKISDIISKVKDVVTTTKDLITKVTTAGLGA